MLKKIILCVIILFSTPTIFAGRPATDKETQAIANQIAKQANPILKALWMAAVKKAKEFDYSKVMKAVQDIYRDLRK